MAQQNLTAYNDLTKAINTARTKMGEDKKAFDDYKESSAKELSEAERAATEADIAYKTECAKTEPLSAQLKAREEEHLNVFCDMLPTCFATGGALAMLPPWLYAEGWDKAKEMVSSSWVNLHWYREIWADLSRINPLGEHRQGSIQTTLLKWNEHLFHRHNYNHQGRKFF